MALQESSGLHSLAALHEHAKAQIQLQAQASRARAEAEQRARFEAERAERERQRMERATSEAAEWARREESMRVEAARRVELARAEGALREREALQAELVSERAARRSAELTAAARLLRQRLFSASAAVLCVATWLSAALVYALSLRPAAQRAELSAEHELADERRARTDAEASAVRLARRNQELASRVSVLESREASLHEPAPTTQPAPTRPVLTPKSAPHSAHGATASALPCRDDGDPLNPCLKAH